jgi:hypothetical protein
MIILKRVAFFLCYQVILKPLPIFDLSQDKQDDLVTLSDIIKVHHFY